MSIGDTLFTLSPRLSSYSQLVKDYTVDFGGKLQCTPLYALYDD